MKSLANLMAHSVEGKYFFYRTFGRVIFYKMLGVANGGFYAATIEIYLEQGAHNKIKSGDILKKNIYKNMDKGTFFIELYDWCRIRDAELVTDASFLKELDTAFYRVVDEGFYQYSGLDGYEAILFDQTNKT